MTRPCPPNPEPESGPRGAILRMPPGLVIARPKSLEDAAFSSGAALAALDLALDPAGADIPLALLRDRLAIDAAAACVAFCGRPERAADLRDAVHLLRPGDLPGPAGAVCVQWRRAVARKIAGKVGDGAGKGQGAPVVRAAQALGAMLAGDPRAEVAALIHADTVLARAMGWDHPVPLIAAGLARRDLRRTGDDLRLACHVAIAARAAGTLRLAADLARRAARLRAVAPALRAKGAGQAVAMFLARDALAPAALTPVMSDRAARRLCDRLVSLGAVREITGRDSFRLYGL